MFEDKVLKFNRAEGFYKKDAQLGNVDGAYKNFVARAKVQRSEMDNFNTPDLDQGADSILRPGETLEDDFDVTFRKANAQGGRIGLKGGSDAKTGMGFQKGHNFGRDLKGKPSLNVQGKNQYANSMTVKEIQAIIDANPDVEYPKNFVAKGLLPRRQIDNNIENLVFKKQGTPKADPAKVTARNTKRNEAKIVLIKNCIVIPVLF
mgnify:CR=1 FL=1